ncbi:hypothetical protein J4E90_007153 [Alternaria incomplexa]|uniref:uncharacterized protein n=1 Tax=Alternaria incomplexa TaxID=1187928 RepID=UPI00221FCE4F|nr:uncharacterized protein J4E90_007153 [Alternaria incomplexa]KAI4910896.1 hypothetical protein J4E90_007153 [Alternaria incomplexa]
MFYSHEVLTSRKYGVATVWLVATTHKRIGRKQIFDVDVQKACQTIVDPVAPMALRLQGNLMYGVSRVYLQQCGYILSDAESARNALLVMLRTVKHTALDADAGKARPEQLIFEDDPSFLPELGLPPPDFLVELDHNFNFDIARSGDSQTLTPFSSQQARSSSHADGIGGLILPTSSPVMAAEFRLEGDDGVGSVGGPSVMGAGDTIQLEDPDFMIADDGEIIQLPPRRKIPSTPARTAGAKMSSDAGASARVRKEHEDGQQVGDQFPGDQADLGFPTYDDDPIESGALSSDGPQQSSQLSEVIESSDTFVAPMRRRRVPRTLPIDAAIELPNKELAGWQRNYRQNMKAAARQKIQKRAAAQAKKNAEHYVWGAGIGGVGERLLGGHVPHPFDMFIGDKFFETIMGFSRNKASGAKHDRDSGIDDATQEESRRVRQRTGEPEVGRSADNEDIPMFGEDDIAVELPREGVSALDDQQIFSAMPWNISASIRGSSVIPRSGRAGMIGSADQSRPGSRFVSASPSKGRVQPLALEGFKNLTSDVDYGGDDFGLPGFSSDFPEPAVQEPSARVREALSTEGENFITFIQERIVEKRRRAQADLEHESDVLQAEAAADIEDIAFEELLPPADNTKMIACQGFMMVLGHGSKGMLDIQQLQHLGEINLKLSKKAKEMQVVELSDAEESDRDGAQEDEDLTEDEEVADAQDIA